MRVENCPHRECQLSGILWSASENTSEGLRKLNKGPSARLFGGSRTKTLKGGTAAGQLSDDSDTDSGMPDPDCKSLQSIGHINREMRHGEEKKTYVSRTGL